MLVYGFRAVWLRALVGGLASSFGCRGLDDQGLGFRVYVDFLAGSPPSHADD